MSGKPEMTKLDPPEKSRTYRFPGGHLVTIESVTHFLARESGMHRLRANSGKLYVVPPGWLCIEIDADDWTV